MSRRAVAALAALCLCLALAGCGGGAPQAKRPTPRPGSDITAVPAPRNVEDPTFHWFVHPSPGGTHVMIGVKQWADTRPRPAVLLVHATGGLNVDYLPFADELFARGFDVAVGCWFATLDVVDDRVSIPCVDGPPFKGVVDTAVLDLDSLVEATHHAFGAPVPLVVVGFSRGAGIAALRASWSRAEPVVLVSGMYEGWNAIGSTVPGGEVDVVQRVRDGADWTAPTLILHGTDDGAVPVVQARNLEAALRQVSVDVAAHYYEGGGHNLAGENEDDVADRVRDFVCAHLACA